MYSSDVTVGLKLIETCLTNGSYGKSGLNLIFIGASMDFVISPVVENTNPNKNNYPKCLSGVTFAIIASLLQNLMIKIKATQGVLRAATATVTVTVTATVTATQTLIIITTKVSDLEDLVIVAIQVLVTITIIITIIVITMK